MSHDVPSTEDEHNAGMHTLPRAYCTLCRETERETARIAEISALKIKLAETTASAEKWLKQRDNALQRAETLLTEKEWVIKRIDEELRREGISLQWTDGGGAACPSGWHRNPYLNWGRLERLTRERDEALAKARSTTLKSLAEDEGDDVPGYLLKRGFTMLSQVRDLQDKLDKANLRIDEINTEVECFRAGVYHPDPEINAGIEADVAEAKALNLKLGIKDADHVGKPDWEQRYKELKKEMQERIEQIHNDYMQGDSGAECCGCGCLTANAFCRDCMTHGGVSAQDRVTLAEGFLAENEREIKRLNLRLSEIEVLWKEKQERHANDKASLREYVAKNIELANTVRELEIKNAALDMKNGALLQKLKMAEQEAHDARESAEFMGRTLESTQDRIKIADAVVRNNQTTAELIDEKNQLHYALHLMVKTGDDFTASMLGEPGARMAAVPGSPTDIARAALKQAELREHAASSIEKKFSEDNDTTSLQALKRWAESFAARGEVLDTGFVCVSEGGDTFEFDPDSVVELMNERDEFQAKLSALYAFHNGKGPKPFICPYDDILCDGTDCEHK